MMLTNLESALVMPSRIKTVVSEPQGVVSDLRGCRQMFVALTRPFRSRNQVSNRTSDAGQL